MMCDYIFFSISRFQLCSCFAALVVIFFPLIEAREIFYALFGFGPLAKRNRARKATLDPTTAQANGTKELGALQKDKFPSDEFKPPHDAEAPEIETKIDVLKASKIASS